MSQELFVRNDIRINAPAAAVWDYLVNPEKTKQYMFGSEAVSDWTIGSELLWKGVYEGKEMVFVKGNIAALEPGKHLTYTVFDPNNPELEDIPGNYLTVTYTLKEEDGQTHLAVSQGDYSRAPGGQPHYEKAIREGGWSTILEAIKKLVEAS